MNRGIRAVELALRLHMLNNKIRPSVSLDLATGYLEVEIYEKLEMDTLDRIYRSKAVLDDKEAVNRIIMDLHTMIRFTEGRLEDVQTKED